MAYTNVEKLDDALAALNTARCAFRPDFCLINRDDDGRGISVEGRWYATREINSATTVVCRAARTVGAALKADPALRIVGDYKGRWIAIRAA